MPKITGRITIDNKPLTGMLIVTALSGKVTQYPIKDGKPDEEVSLQSGFYNVQAVPSEAQKQSSYPQYKWRVPEGDPNTGEVQFDKLEIEQLA